MREAYKAVITFVSSKGNTNSVHIMWYSEKQVGCVTGSGGGGNQHSVRLLLRIKYT